MTRFDIHIQVRGGYDTKFGGNYLKLKEEYGVDGAWLVKRVFEDAVLIIADRRLRESDALRKKQEADRELNELVAGRR